MQLFQSVEVVGEACGDGPRGGYPCALERNAEGRPGEPANGVRGADEFSDACSNVPQLRIAICMPQTGNLHDEEGEGCVGSELSHGLKLIQQSIAPDDAGRRINIVLGDRAEVAWRPVRSAALANEPEVSWILGHGHDYWDHLVNWRDCAFT
jgi:hypothetical protein